MAHSKEHYIKIWMVLVGLLVVSVVGPMAEILILTLITAFGIALVKAYLVVVHFMHLTVDKKFVSYMLATCLAFMLLLFAFVAPDVMNHHGTNWENHAAKQETHCANLAHAKKIDKSECKKMSFQDVVKLAKGAKAGAEKAPAKSPKTHKQ